MAKDVLVEDAATGAAMALPVTTSNIQFVPDGGTYLDDLTDNFLTFYKTYFEATLATAVRVKVSPEGVAFSATGGQGSRQVTIINTAFVHVYASVDALDLSVPGWAILTLGDHTVAYSTWNTRTVISEPMP